MVKVCSYIAQYLVHWTAQSAFQVTPGRPVHADTNSGSLRRIQPLCYYCMQTNHSHFHHCLLPDLYSFIQLRGITHCRHSTHKEWKMDVHRRTWLSLPCFTEVSAKSAYGQPSSMLYGSLSQERLWTTIFPALWKSQPRAPVDKHLRLRCMW